MTQSNMSSGRLVCCIASNGTGDDRCIDALKPTGMEAVIIGNVSNPMLLLAPLLLQRGKPEH